MLVLSPLQPYFDKSRRIGEIESVKVDIGDQVTKGQVLAVLDPEPYQYERAHVTSNTYYDWMRDRVFFLVLTQAYLGNLLKTLKEFPPRQKPASFSIDQVMEKLQTSDRSK